MSQQTLKELLKPPFKYDEDAYGDCFITDRSQRFTVKMPHKKVNTEMLDFATAALNEKWERDFGKKGVNDYQYHCRKLNLVFPNDNFCDGCAEEDLLKCLNAEPCARLPCKQCETRVCPYWHFITKKLWDYWKPA